MTRDLGRLLRPRSIATFGGGWAANVVEQSLKMGFTGEIWPVHPSRDQVGGLRAYPSLDALPGAPDASFIGVNRALTVDVVAGLAAMGAGGAVCFASGFAEAEAEIGGGADLQARLVQAAGAMPILGPNCYGVINYLDGALMWPDQHGGRRCDRGVAILTQSSNILINLTMQRRGLPIAYCLAAGNQAQTDLATMAMGLLDDPRVTAIGLHIEGIADLGRFQALAALARARRVPIIALTVGASAEAQAATLSHTASLAGGQAAAAACFAHLGIPRVDTLPTFLETLKLLHVHGPLAGREIASLSCSGGEASLIADTAARHRTRFRPLTPPQHAAVKATLGPIVTVANPLDYHTFIWNDGPAMTATFTAMLSARFDIGLLVLDFPRTDRCSDATWTAALDAIASAAKTTQSPVAVVASLPENLGEPHADAILARGLAPMLGFDETLAAIDAAADIQAAWDAPAPAPLPGPRRPGTPRLLSEAEAKAALAAHGLAVPPGITTPRAGLARAAAELGGPLALKALGLAHKTEAGAVALHLTHDQVTAAAAAMPGDTFLVERMVTGAVAELILGVTADPAYGLTLTLGAGGILAEILADTQTLMIPATPAQVDAALDRLCLAPVLRGYRGKPAADRAALLAAIAALQAYALANPVMELDINPLICTPTGAWVADALIRLTE